MFTLRCTQKLLQRMRLDASDLRGAVTHEPTTALGDWYAHLLIIQRQHLVMLVSDRSRLCILTTARDMDRLPQRFHTALDDLLHALDVPEDAICLEQKAMSEMCYGLTTGTVSGRSVLGSIKDMTNALHNSEIGERSLSDWNLYYSRWLHKPLEYVRPKEVARRLLIEARERHKAP